MTYVRRPNISGLYHSLENLSPDGIAQVHFTLFSRSKTGSIMSTEGATQMIHVHAHVATLREHHFLQTIWWWTDTHSHSGAVGGKQKRLGNQVVWYSFALNRVPGTSRKQNSLIFSLSCPRWVFKIPVTNVKVLKNPLGLFKVHVLLKKIRIYINSFEKKNDH